jgi:acetyltransferase
MARLDLFFNPRRIAIVGASERGMYPAGILRNLLDHGYSGEIYPVNPNRSDVFGLPCYPDLAHTPQPADLAILTIPRQAVLPTLRQCLSVGVPAALIISAGFAEADDEGRRLQTELAALLTEAGPRLAVVGPNCAGLANIPGRVIATRLPAPPKPGPISFVSQSGALMMALYGLFADRQLGLSRLLSLGNQVDVGLAESVAHLVADEQTTVIGAFVEGILAGPAFVTAVRGAVLAGKPVVLLKSGQTESGQRAALTHTAALSGASRVFEAVCRQFGVIQVADVMELIDTCHLLAAFGRRLDGQGRMAVVTQSGGLGSLTADLAELAGLALPPLGEQLQGRLRNLPHMGNLALLGNPADVQGASVIGPATAETLAPFLADPEIDLVLLLLAKSAVRPEDAATAEAIIAAARSSDKPLVVVWVGQRSPVGETSWPLGHRLLVEAGVPLFDQPGAAIRALARAVAYWRFRAEWPADEAIQSDERPVQARKTSPTSPGGGVEALAGQPARRSPVEASTPTYNLESKSKNKPFPTSQRRLLSYPETAALLEAYQTPLAPARLIQSAAEASRAAQELGFPVALKAVAPAFSHKSEAGLVQLNLASAEAVETTARMLLAQTGQERLEGLLVQQMITGGIEMIVGVSYDPQFGPVLALGAGGVLVELLDDVTLRLPPLTQRQALAMIRETRAWRWLQGFRHYPPADVSALARLLVYISRLAVEQAGQIASLDLNPVLVLPEGQGVWVVDARVVGK